MKCQVLPLSLCGKLVGAMAKEFFLFFLFIFSVLPMDVTASERVTIPVPKTVIYAGQTIDAQLLRDRSVAQKYLRRVSVFEASLELVGKVARTTLMPNHPIPINHVVEPNVVEVNKRTTMKFEQGMLKITAEVVPLNDAKTGEAVRARNISTGVVVYGTALEDGSIIANGKQ